MSVVWIVGWMFLAYCLGWLVGVWVGRRERGLASRAQRAQASLDTYRVLGPRP